MLGIGEKRNGDDLLSAQPVWVFCGKEKKKGRK